MNKTINVSLFLVVLCYLNVWSQNELDLNGKSVSFNNIWTKPPVHIPNDVSIDAPLMGNGDLTMSVGFKGDQLRYYLSKNDFWRLRSKADGLSGPRVVGFVDIKVNGFNEKDFFCRTITWEWCYHLLATKEYTKGDC